MKELSIEEKAKAYDKVREKIALRFGSNVAEEIFSEYEESKDERIRKEIISAIKEDWPGHKDWIAWLEKQGDINRHIQEEIEKQTKRQWKSEKQGNNISGECNDTALEQQLKIWFEKGKCSGIDDVIFHPQKYGLEKQNEQKPAWSEEDEERFESCIKVLQTSDGYETINTKWLKSLKERYTWKPSDEQMDALLYVVRNYTPGVTERIAWESIKTLELMFKDLKKLKGEQL